ncbi:Ingression protein 1 [Nakaseomyces glabratus]|uniref:Ingression protein 1 n=1 Tax=Candida glabrata TaxID=5478 RepID=A0A0W0E842_CANGB|nr:Ingression protein 1 [Nakaseomyces glabratus]KTB08929.1 Ingression protein 1 [Nakaseomyces glabratus]KTB11068.1 Ingression protein 1 [Nakaseomyces glabratus]KTB20177.1 Ingression protein 1 [Nakaseomyces glabratus]
MSEEVWDGNQGTLSVYVSKAKDLPNLDKLDKQDVLLRLRIAHMTRESDTIIRAGQTPIFKYYEKFEITPELRPLMYVEIYSDRRKKAPILIGRCEVDLLNGIRADPKEGYCTWYELKKPNNDFAGTVFIELTFKPTYPTFRRDGESYNSRNQDKSMAARPIPPLPDDMSQFENEPESFRPNHYNSHFSSSSSSRTQSRFGGSESDYLHASAVRQVTPAIVDDNHHRVAQRFATSDNYGNDNGPANFMSSVGTSSTVTTQDSSTTTITNNSDTKFHFANLRKLKEKINIFKNPNNSEEPETKNSNVDIEALQKAIGINNDAQSDDVSSTESFHERYQASRDISKSSSRGHNDALFKYSGGQNNEPPLPPLPKSPSRSPTRDRSPHRNPHSHHYHQHQEMASPKLPPLPTSRSNSTSPTRRRPPPI